MKRYLIILILIAIATALIIRLVSYSIGRIIAVVLLAVVIGILVVVNRKKK